jgi:predicted kinase
MRLVVIAGPASSGKHRLARHMCAEQGLLLLSRDATRQMVVTPIPEWLVTYAVADLAKALIERGANVCVVGFNMEDWDHKLWAEVAQATGAELEWMDTRDPAIQRMVPPIPGEIEHANGVPLAVPG